MSDHGRMHAPGPDVADELASSGSVVPGQDAPTHGHRRVTSFRARRSTISDRQQAIWDEHGTQCGYCTPGMVLAAVELLVENASPTDDEIKSGLAGNLCRCTGYQNIVKAVLAVSE